MATIATECRCGNPQLHRIRSRHTTSEGKLVWGECICGVLHAWLYRVGESAGVLVAHGPAAARPRGPAISVVHLLDEKERNVG
jgi:hypothetical protein